MSEPDSLGDRLRMARRRKFVGRTDELEVFKRALAPSERSFTVLFVHGCGGIGKSSLLDMMADMAGAAGTTVIRVDGKALPPTLEALTGALRSGFAAGRPDMELAEAAATTERAVVMFDSYDYLRRHDEWLRETFMAMLPDDALVVIASRTPPGHAWTGDPAWRELLHVTKLENLTSGDVETYLTIERVPPHLQTQLALLSYGHPLALSLLVDVASRRHLDASDLPTLAAVPDVVRELLHVVVGETPSVTHRAALEVCAHSRFTTECLLRAVLGETADVESLFAWLRGLPYIEEAPYGLFSNELARDLLDVDRRWRDTEGYAALHARVRAHLVQRLSCAADDRETHRRITDVIFVSRCHPGTARLWDWRSVVWPELDHVRSGDRAAIVAMTDAQQGPHQAALVAHWLDRQPQSFRVFRIGDGEPLGFVCILDLGEATEHDRAVDAGADTLCRFAERYRPPRQGEQALAWRFFIDRSAGRERSPLVLLAAIWRVERALAKLPCSWEFVGIFDDAELWGPVMAYLDFARLELADYEIEGRHYQVFAHDWRRTAPAEWLDRTFARDLGAPADASPAVDLEAELSELEFADAVRCALRDLHSADRLSVNPLLRSHAVRGDNTADSPVAALRELISRAASALKEDPRADGLYRVLDRTFLRPSGSQAQTAVLLNIHFNTYRRHRDRAVRRIVEWMWERELGSH